MLIKIVRLLAALIISLGSTSAFAQLKKVRLAIPTFDIVTLPLKMAQAKGFYQKEGLEVEIILVTGSLGVPAVLGNSVDFSTASGSILAAAARGVPVKLVSIITTKPTFDLISDPKIQSFQQLRGKLPEPGMDQRRPRLHSQESRYQDADFDRAGFRLQLR